MRAVALYGTGTGLAPRGFPIAMKTGTAAEYRKGYHVNYIGIALFVGLAAWDANALKQVGAQVGSHPARGGLVVIGALKLYLDFINLFLLMLRAASRG